MAADLNSIIKQLTESSIIAQGKLENFLPPKADPKTVEELVQALVKSENLTAFQGHQVKAGKAKALILGEYTILDKIGAGGMGQVFKAQHRRMKRVVAIKMLPPAMTKDAAAISRFEREVEAAAKLRHPNIVAADDAGQVGAVHFLVMEHVDGNDLSAIVKKDGPLPVNKAVNYILQAARGLEFAHNEGVVHRDIKPANLLLDKKGVVKILDMGLARIEQADGDAQSELTGTGTIMGTVDYMSPEQALNTKNADHRADIYSLGISLYYLLAGKAAYGGDTAMEKLMAHQTQPIPSLQDTQTTVSKQLEAVFKKMVAKRIEDRYQSMSEVVEALEGLGLGGSITGNKGDIASTIDLFSADRKKLVASTTTKKPLGSLTDVVALEKSKNLILKIVGGSFGTIIAPVLVFYLIRHLEKEEKPATPPAATVPAATVQPVVVATNTTVQPPVPGTPDVGQSNKPWNTPAFQAWMKEVQAIPAGQQVEAVGKKLVELNPGFDGKVMPKLERAMVTGLDFATEELTDISPVRALAGLQTLACNAAKKGSARSELWDLSPLVGMKLTKLECGNTEVFDVSPLHGMPLETLNATGTKVTDLSPLHGMPLKTLSMSSTKVTDLSSLKGCPLVSLTLVSTPVNDLSSLRGMTFLTTLQCDQCRQLADLSPLADCKALTLLKATTTKVTPEGVAALQKALPNCKIEWDGKAKGAGARDQGLVRTWETPDFQAWVEVTQALPAEQQIEAVSKKLMELNPGFNGSVTGINKSLTPKIENGVVTEFGFVTDKVTDISPVRALAGLKVLKCVGSLGSSLDKGILSDLSPLAEMPLTGLWFGSTQVSDLSPLEGMPLASIAFTPKNITKGLDVIRQMKSLKIIGLRGDRDNFPPAEFWKKYDAGEFGKSAAPAKLAYLDPAFQKWVADTQKLSAEQQIEAVRKKLMELNPGFDGALKDNYGRGTPKIENLVVTKVGLFTDEVTDLSPVRALAGLNTLNYSGSAQGKGRLSDLSPLKGMQLTSLTCGGTKVSDLSPLEGMPLTYLICGASPVADLSPLKGVRLTHLNCSSSSVADLSPLQGMLLTNLDCYGTRVVDLSPLKGMPLQTLSCGATKVPDLSPIRGAPLKNLYCYYTPVSDLSPLEGMSLTEIQFTPSRITKGLEVVRQMKSIKTIGIGTGKTLPSEEFWKNYDAGEFAKPASKKLPYLDPAFQQWVAETQKLPAEQQIEAVRKKLMELNPGFDGKLMPTIQKNKAVTLQFLLDQVTDISPVRAIADLEGLSCTGTVGIQSRLSDLSPLAGLRLTTLVFKQTQLSDLSPLEGMPLTILVIAGSNTHVSDLAPLKGMPLTTLDCRFTQVADISPLKTCTALKLLMLNQTKVTAAQVAALQKALPNCKIEWDDPAKATKPALAPAGTK